MSDAKKIISDLAKDIVRRGLSVPAIFFLESSKYVSFIGSQFLVFLGPIATCFINNKKFYNLTSILEKKSNIEFLISEIERINLITKS
ncbi:MAG: hypothetical protein CMG39_03775 [Candidatus Marinimicrobia bacterium]|nr:hypothetical protein [Candidatus Neomarinimicrobiota bacterium]|tara:strand:+ start:2811 stop:3074 length:264 start_codon:yes stop_codon:yes gene_type:complete